MTTPPDTPSSAGPPPGEESSRSRSAADPALTSARPKLQQAARYRLVARDDPADPSEWDRRAHAAQVAVALATTEALVAALMAGDLSTLDQLLAPTFCWWSVSRRSGDGAPTHTPLPMEPLVTRSTFLALTRRWRHAFGDLVIALGPSLIDTEDRLLGPTDPQANARVSAPPFPHAPPAQGVDDATPPDGSTNAVASVTQPSHALRPAETAVTFVDRVGSRVSSLVTLCWSATARHTGTLGRVPATGAVVRLTGIAHLRYDATGQVTHFATTCETSFWAQLPGLASFANRLPLDCSRLQLPRVTDAW